MASKTFNVKILQNLKTEADWLADETYQILPRESVEAIVIKTVEQEGASVNKFYIRTKINNTDTSKLFKDLSYTDEYIEFKLDELTNTLASLQGQVNEQGGILSSLSTGLEDKANVSALADYMPVAGGTFTGSIKGQTPTTTADETELTTVKYVKDSVSTLSTQVETNKNNIEGMSGTVSSLSVGLEDKADKSSLNSYMPVAGGTFTGTVKGLTPGENADDTELATVKYVKDSAGNVDTSALETQVSTNTQNITKNANDIKSLDGTVNELSGTISSFGVGLEDKADKSSLADYMPVTGGTFTGSVSGVTPDGTNNKALATVEYVQNNGGTQKPAVILSTTEPTADSQDVGGIWLKQL